VMDYYQLRLPPETERYVFRILAIKAVLSNPAGYGYELPKGGGNR
jgi:membrane-bound lytic murein transglycosylase D